MLSMAFHEHSRIACGRGRWLALVLLLTVAFPAAGLCEETVVIGIYSSTTKGDNGESVSIIDHLCASQQFSWGTAERCLTIKDLRATRSGASAAEEMTPLARLAWLLSGQPNDAILVDELKQVVRQFLEKFRIASNCIVEASTHHFVTSDCIFMSQQRGAELTDTKYVDFLLAYFRMQKEILIGETRYRFENKEINPVVVPYTEWSEFRKNFTEQHNKLIYEVRRSAFFGVIVSACAILLIGLLVLFGRDGVRFIKGLFTQEGREARLERENREGIIRRIAQSDEIPSQMIWGLMEGVGPLQKVADRYLNCQAFIEGAEREITGKPTSSVGADTESPTEAGANDARSSMSIDPPYIPKLYAAIKPIERVVNRYRALLEQQLELEKTQDSLTRLKMAVNGLRNAVGNLPSENLGNNQQERQKNQEQAVLTSHGPDLSSAVENDGRSGAMASSTGGGRADWVVDGNPLNDQQQDTAHGSKLGSNSQPPDNSTAMPARSPEKSCSQMPGLAQKTTSGLPPAVPGGSKSTDAPSADKQKDAKADSLKRGSQSSEQKPLTEAMKKGGLPQSKHSDDKRDVSQQFDGNASQPSSPEQAPPDTPTASMVDHAANKFLNNGNELSKENGRKNKSDGEIAAAEQGESVGSKGAANSAPMDEQAIINSLTDNVSNTTINPESDPPERSMEHEKTTSTGGDEGAYATEDKSNIKKNDF